ncbi:MAG: hypothetical protein OXB98_05810 [Bryobacterales bacterium]|nr:hypothetical protein [Bryobacterales bacterium]
MPSVPSYGRIAARYPLSGFSYAYAGRAFGTHAGFLTGWVLFLDYHIIPVIRTLYDALRLQRLVPVNPYLA